MGHACPTTVTCVGCGIPLSDGYTDGLPPCGVCKDRRNRRLRRGERYTPTGYAGEMIDNQTGRLVYAG